MVNVESRIKGSFRVKRIELPIILYTIYLYVIRVDNVLLGISLGSFER